MKAADGTEPARELGIRAYVGGLLYIEGLVCLLIGAVMLFGYWPPYAKDGERANPVSMVGAWITGIALTYMIVVGIILFLYNLAKPAGAEPMDPLRLRARRYSSLRSREAYLFDSSISCEADADEAELARQLI